MMSPIHTLVPNQAPIELVAYYPKFQEYYLECELQTKRWFVEYTQPNWVMLDAGANIGYYSILFSRLAHQGHIYAFEPTDTIEMLRANLAFHNCHNVVPLPIALGRVSGTREDDIFKIWGDSPERKPYDFATVDDMVSRLNLSRLDCIKIDVDSFDLDVLVGAEGTLKRFDPWVVVELNHALSKRNQSVPEALEWLYSIGYGAAHITDHDNYILRRREDAAKTFCPYPAMRLSFETQPLILPAKYERANQLEGVFESGPRLHNNATMLEPREHSLDTLRFEVPGPRWSYAASWLRTGTAVNSKALVVEFEAEVADAAIGVGFIRSDDSGYVGREVEMHPKRGSQTITVTADMANEIGYLIMRNIDVGGLSATVDVHSIRAFDAVEASGKPSSNLLSNTKRRMSIAECVAALNGTEPSTVSASLDAPGFDIVPVEELGSALGFVRAFVPEVQIYRHGLPDFKTEEDESAIFSYIYGQFKPTRHLEFGTWEGHGVVLCASVSDAEIWTINLAEGERDSAGNSVYAPSERDALGETEENGAAVSRAKTSSDSGDSIGWKYRAAGFGHRVHQIFADSRDLDVSIFGDALFDTVFIDGGHSKEVASNDTEKALSLLRPGGLIIWHDFCPDVETLERNEAPRGVVAAVIGNYAAWKPALRQLFWIRPSWILLGVKK